MRVKLKLTGAVAAQGINIRTSVKDFFFFFLKHWYLRISSIPSRNCSELVLKRFGISCKHNVVY